MLPHLLASLWVKLLLTIAAIYLQVNTDAQLCGNITAEYAEHHQLVQPKTWRMSPAWLVSSRVESESSLSDEVFVATHNATCCALCKCATPIIFTSVCMIRSSLEILSDHHNIFISMRWHLSPSCGSVHSKHLLDVDSRSILIPSFLLLLCLLLKNRLTGIQEWVLAKNEH